MNQTHIHPLLFAPALFSQIESAQTEDAQIRSMMPVLTVPVVNIDQSGGIVATGIPACRRELIAILP